MDMIVAGYDLEFKMGWPCPYPSARLAEERLIMGEVDPPAREETDLNFCGHPQAYQPVIDRVQQIQRDLSAIGKDALPAQ